MKEKNKKILNGLGVGALACFGMFTLTGCTINLTDEQMEKVMYVVDESEHFMKDTLDLLGKQNAQLDKEDAWNLYKVARTRYLLNDDNIRDNMVLKLTSDDDGGFEMKISCYRENGSYMVMSEYSETDKIFWYSYDYKTYKYENRDGDAPSKILLGVGEVENFLNLGVYISIDAYKCEKEDIVKCDIAENGNYIITFINEFEYKDEDVEDSPVLYDCCIYLESEITPDGRFVRDNIIQGELNNRETGEYINEIIVGSLSFEYLTVDVEKMTTMLETAKAAEVDEE